MGMFAPMCAYTRGHVRAYVCIYAWACSRQKRVGMRTRMYTYTTRHNRAHGYVHVQVEVCIQECAWSNSYLPLTFTYTCVLIAAVCMRKCEYDSACAYTCEHDFDIHVWA
jgi:hypothetical protein